MTIKPTYEELEQRVKELEQETVKRKQAEEELRDSGDYRTLADVSRDIIFMLDLTGKLTYLNPAYEKITGNRVEDFIGRAQIEAVVPEYREYVVDMFKRGIAGEDGLREEAAQILGVHDEQQQGES